MANRLTNRTLPPTAANIISSLGVRGAVKNLPAGAQYSSLSGFIPVLGEDGKISLDFIPSDAATLSVRRITNVAIVDPNTTETVRTGSVIAPFKTIGEAAACFVPDNSGGTDTCAIVLTPGSYTNYEDCAISFDSYPMRVFIIASGEGRISSSGNTIAITGLGNGSSLTLANIFTEANISVGNCGDITCLGVTKVLGSLSVQESLTSTARLHISSESYIASTNISKIDYLSSASRIGNDAAIVEGDTVQGAINTLGSRAIRVADIDAGDSGFDYDEDRYNDIPSTKINGKHVYDLRGHDKVFVDGINHLVIMWRNPNVDTLTANKVKADNVETDSAKMNELILGGFRFTVDAFGYVVITDGDEPIDPPEDMILIRDSVTGVVYGLGVTSGRMILTDETDEHDSSSSPSSSDIPLSRTIVDSETGIEYSVTIEDGKTILSNS